MAMRSSCPSRQAASATRRPIPLSSRLGAPTTTTAWSPSRHWSCGKPRDPDPGRGRRRRRSRGTPRNSRPYRTPPLVAMPRVCPQASRPRGRRRTFNTTDLRPIKDCRLIRLFRRVTIRFQTRPLFFPGRHQRTPTLSNLFSRRPCPNISRFPALHEFRTTRRDP
jgi:hypothetical protein